MKYLTLAQLCTDNTLKNKRVFIRSDLNVPLDAERNITDDTRIRASLQAIQMAHAAGASVMVTSHLGRPTEGALTEQDSLQPVASLLSRYLGTTVRLIENWVDGVVLAPNEIVLLENCRGNLGEKKNDAALGQKMAHLCDVFVNDAFGTAHRAEATTHAIARYAPIACAGPLLDAELQALGKALHAPKRPLVAIVGGSKVSTKLDILTTLSQTVDQLIVGGGIANTFMLAAGLPIGRSLAEPDLVPQARDIIERMAARGAAVPIPTDVIVAERFDPVPVQFNFSLASAVLKTAATVDTEDRILDIGPQTSQTLADIIQNAGTIVWNGPVGVFEHRPFAQGTQALAKAIAQSSAFSIAGGGDTIAAISQFKVTDQIDYISTGGGAFLEFLEGKTLPAVAILLERFQ